MFYYWFVCLEFLGNESINSFELYLAHYLSTPGYSKNAMKRFTDVTLKLTLDIVKYQFIESTIRGDISMICKESPKASNNFLKSYYVNKPTSCIIYLDANNLHGHSMMQLVPTEIDWVDLKNFDLHNYSDAGPVGCFVEVDLDYPDELHELDNDYPLACEKNKSNKRNAV